jgi:hypothetical protein
MILEFPLIIAPYVIFFPFSRGKEIKVSPSQFLVIAAMKDG